MSPGPRTPMGEAPGWTGPETIGAAVAAAAEGAAAAEAAERHRAELAAMLARYTGPAAEWPVEVDIRATEPGDDRGPGLVQVHLVCTVDRQSVYCLAKDLAHGVAVTSVGQLLAAVTRHYRESHTDGGGLPT